MSYLARLKQIEVNKMVHHKSIDELTMVPKGTSGSSVSMPISKFENISLAVPDLDDVNFNQHISCIELTQLTKAPYVSCVSANQVACEKNSAINDVEDIVVGDWQELDRLILRYADLTAMPAERLARLLEARNRMAPINVQADIDQFRKWIDELSSPQNRIKQRCCQHCKYFARPGMSAGYCSVRNDLPLAFGANHPLRQLPSDNGACCDQWHEKD